MRGGEVAREHFGLRHAPFSGEANPDDFHPTRRHVAAIDFVVGAIRDGRSPVAVEGVPGAGKTMLVRMLPGELPQPCRTVILDAPAASGAPFSVAMARALDLPGVDEAECGRAVGGWLASRIGAGERVVVAIEDADRMPESWLREIRELVSARPAPMTFVMTIRPGAGAPVAELLDSDGVHRLRGIERAGLGGYLQARLMAAGARDASRFTDAAVAVLWELSEGIPGRVGVIAEAALSLAASRAAEEVDHEILLNAAEEVAERQERPTARSTIVRLEERAEGEREVTYRAVAGGGSRGRGRGFPTPAAAGNEPGRLAAGESGPGTAEATPAPPAPEGPRTYRASSDPQGEIDRWTASPTRREPPAVDSEAPARSPSRSRPAAGRRRSESDPFRDSDPGSAPFGPELLPVLSEPHGLVAEWFRVLRVRLEDWLQAVGGPPRSLLISSSEANAGKTFVASNLALLFASDPELRVILVDGDLRRPRFGALFGVSRRPGLADILAGRADADDCLQTVRDTALSVISAGRPGNPRDLMSPERIAAALQAMRRHADLIVIDSPPMEPLADARSMAKAVDGVMLVARAGHTRAPELERSVRALPEERFVGTVITGVEDAQAERAYGDYSRSRR